MSASAACESLIRFLQKNAPYTAIPENPARLIRAVTQHDPLAEHAIRQAETQLEHEREERIGQRCLMAEIPHRDRRI